MGAVERVDFSVPVVFGWQRVGYDRRSGRRFERRETAAVKAAVRAAFGAACPEGARFPVFGPHVPVIVSVDCYRPMPKSRPKRMPLEPDTYKPDIDNITKLVLDALNGSAYADDAQVVEIRVTKHPRSRAEGERTDISIARGWDGGGRDRLEQGETEELT